MLKTDTLPQALLDALGCEESAQLRTINQSLINETYCLMSGGDRFLVKRFLADQSTGRSRQLLYTIQSKLALQGLAPKPLFLSEDDGMYAEQWVAASLTPLQALDEELRMAKLAESLAAVHRLPITTSRMDLSAQWNAYARAAKLDDSDIRIKRAKELVFLSTSSINSRADLVFCHNDLAMSHIIDHENLKIIDWEYCGTGNRYFDIASTIAINRLSASQRSLFISYYARAFDFADEIVQQGVFSHEPLVTLTYQLWYAAITEHVKHTL